MSLSTCLTGKDLFDFAVTELLKIVKISPFCAKYGMDIVTCLKIMGKIPQTVFTILRWMAYPTNYDEAFIQSCEEKIEVIFY